MRDNIRTITYPLPPRINSLVVYNDDFYTVLVNDNLSPQGRIKAFNHELNHINNGDFDRDIKADTIEYLTHKGDQL